MGVVATISGRKSTQKQWPYCRRWLVLSG